MICFIQQVNSQWVYGFRIRNVRHIEDVDRYVVGSDVCWLDLLGQRTSTRADPFTAWLEYSIGLEEQSCSPIEKLHEPLQQNFSTCYVNLTASLFQLTS